MPESTTDRRDRYAAAIRQRIKDMTGPESIFPGQIRFGATEYDVADVAIALADAELGAERADLVGLLRAEKQRADDAITRETDAEDLAEERTAERDAARRWAVALESETAELRAAIDRVRAVADDMASTTGARTWAGWLREALTAPSGVATGPQGSDGPEGRAALEKPSGGRTDSRTDTTETTR